MSKSFYSKGGEKREREGKRGKRKRAKEREDRRDENGIVFLSRQRRMSHGCLNKNESERILFPDRMKSGEHSFAKVLERGDTWFWREREK